MRFSLGSNSSVRPLFAYALAALTVGCTTSAAPVAERTSSATANDRGETTGARADSATLAPAGDAPSSEAAPATTVAAASAAERSPATDVAESGAAAAPVVREAAKPVVGGPAAGVPPVLLSAGHAQLCKVNVGNVIPTIELPKLDGGAATLESLAGPKATVVVFWTADPWMSATALEDLARTAVPDGVAIVGVAVGVKADAAPAMVTKTGAKFPQLVDADGAAFAQVGDVALPRVYVLDAQRQIAWFDIEYSEATRRELQQTLTALTGPQ